MPIEQNNKNKEEIELKLTSRLAHNHDKLDRPLRFRRLDSYNDIKRWGLGLIVFGPGPYILVVSNFVGSCRLLLPRLIS